MAKCFNKKLYPQYLVLAVYSANTGVIYKTTTERNVQNTITFCMENSALMLNGYVSYLIRNIDSLLT